MSEMTSQAKERWNFRFWDPIECIGGKVYFGNYWECWVDGKRTLQTDEQYRIKKDMGFFRRGAPTMTSPLDKQRREDLTATLRFEQPTAGTGLVFDLADWASCDIHELSYLRGEPGCVRCQHERAPLPVAKAVKL